MPDDEREHRDDLRADLAADVPMPQNIEAILRTLPDVPEPTEEECKASLAEFRRRNAARDAGLRGRVEVVVTRMEANAAEAGDEARDGMPERRKSFCEGKQRAFWDASREIRAALEGES